MKCLKYWERLWFIAIVALNFSILLILSSCDSKVSHDNQPVPPTEYKVIGKQLAYPGMVFKRFNKYYAGVVLVKESEWDNVDYFGEVAKEIARVEQLGLVRFYSDSECYGSLKDDQKSTIMSECYLGKIGIKPQLFENWMTALKATNFEPYWPYWEDKGSY